MTPHPVVLAFGFCVAAITVVAASVATRVQLLPDVIDVSIIPTGSGLGSLALVFYGAARRLEPDRLGRLALLGTLLGGGLTAALLALALLADVLS